jgi:hypothetical protein
VQTILASSRLTSPATAPRARSRRRSLACAASRSPPTAWAAPSPTSWKPPRRRHPRRAGNLLVGGIPDELDTGAQQRRRRLGRAVTPNCRRPGRVSGAETEVGEHRRRLGQGSDAGDWGRAAAPETRVWQWHRRPGWGSGAGD